MEDERPKTVVESLVANRALVGDRMFDIDGPNDGTIVRDIRIENGYLVIEGEEWTAEILTRYCAFGRHAPTNSFLIEAPGWGLGFRFEKKNGDAGTIQ